MEIPFLKKKKKSKETFIFHIFKKSSEKLSRLMFTDGFKRPVMVVMDLLYFADKTEIRRDMEAILSGGCEYVLHIRSGSGEMTDNKACDKNL